MKIVHVEDFIHPDAGYQVNLLSRLQVKDGHDVTVVTAELGKTPARLTQFFGVENIAARDERFRKETGVRIVRVPVLAYYSARAIFSTRIFKVVKGLKPDAVFVHGLDSLTAMTFIWASPFLPYPIITDCHALEMGSMHRFRDAFRMFYRLAVAPLILKMKIPVVRLVDSDYVEKHLGVPLDRSILLSFGTDTDLFRPDPERKRHFLEENGLDPSSFVVLYAGKLDDQKGGAFLAEAINEKITTKSGRDVVFLIIGNSAGDYGRQVEATLSTSKNRVIRMPTQRYFDLSRLYPCADLAVFPKQCSMSFFEVQSCGLPVLFEHNEINATRMEHGGAVTFEAGNLADFRNRLTGLLDLPAEQFQCMQRNARAYIVENYDYLPIAKQFTDVLRRAYECHQAKH